MLSPFYHCHVDITSGSVTTLRKTNNFGSRNKITGYYSIGLKEKKTDNYGPIYLHRLVWETANGIKIPKGWHIHHVDNDKSNNSILNLSAVTCKLNNWFAAKNRDYTKILEKRRQNGFKVKVIAETGEGPTVTRLEFKSMRETARFFNCNVGTISKILSKEKYYNTLEKDGKTYTFVRA